jgi:SAM-dependent methyltransferase
MKTLLKKNPFMFEITRKIYKFIYRKIYYNKYVYFLNHRARPLSNWYGFDRGRPLDRYYIENFINQNNESIHGTCLELLNDNYITKFGGNRVDRKIILDIDNNNKNANLISDLRNLKEIQDKTIDCIILTQVLQFIDDTDAAISECYRILKPGGVLLATLPSISRIDCISGVGGDYWRFTTASAQFLFEKRFRNENLKVYSLGNAKIVMYFYAGLAQEDTPKKLLDNNDENFPLIICIKATK